MKVSVIIPVFNLEPFISRAVKSVLAQPEVAECIVVDDGSTDNTADVCRALGQNDPRIRVFRHRQNLGVSASRNLGMENASSPYIAFLDADDYYLPNRFAHTRSIFESDSSVDAVAEACATLNSKGEIMRTTAVDDNISPDELFLHMEPFGKGGHFSVCALTLKRDALNAVGGFNKSLSLGEDTEWISRLVMRLKVRTANPEKPVSIRGIHQGNSSNQTAELQMQKIKLCLILLKWMVENKMNVSEKEAVVHTTLKYHFEANNLSASKSRWKKKVADLRLLRLLTHTDPDCKKYPGYIYFRKVVFHRPIAHHFNFYQ